MDSDDEVPEAVPIGQEVEQGPEIHQPEATAPKQHRTVPVLLITGFLGAGKTTCVSPSTMS